jgi:hypothetical protein
MEWLISQFPHIPYWYSLREFKRDDGSTVYSSLWNGLRVGLSVPDTQTMVEAGTSSCRVYKNGTNGWAPLNFTIDGEKWEQFWDLAKKERSGEVSVGHTDKPSLEWLKLELVAGGAITKEDADKAFYFATGQARDIGGIGGFRTISHEEELRYEFESVVYAHSEVPQASLHDHNLVLTVGAGGGSTQGYDATTKSGYTKNFGLKPLMKLVGDAELTKKVSFDSHEAYLSAILLVKNHLKAYETESFWSRWFTWGSWYDWWYCE